MKTTCIKVLLAILCPLALLGCGDKGGSSAAPRKADTPMQALENMRQAFLDGDKEAFAQCFDATGQQAEMVDAFCDFSIAASRFDQAMRKAYGEDAVTQAMGGGARNVPFEDDNWLKDVTIQVEGDTATAVKAGQGEDLRLVKRDGRWKIDAASMLSDKGATDQGVEQLTTMFQTMTRVVTDVSQKVGQSGYTAEKINQEMRQAMMSAMMQAAGTPGMPAK